jgi:hypothetical protein
MKSLNKRDKQGLKVGRTNEVLTWAKVLGQIVLIGKIVEEIIKLFV